MASSLIPLVSEFDCPGQDPSLKLEIGLLLSGCTVIAKGKHPICVIMITDRGNRVRILYKGRKSFARSLIGSGLPCHDADLNHADLVRRHGAARREEPIDVCLKISLVE